MTTETIESPPTNEEAISVNTRERLAQVPMPARIAGLPREHRGYPVPVFVQWRDGKPDFRVMRPDYLVHCVKHKVCWICGGPLGRNMTFPIGPMCMINRTSAEPPSHLECAEYSAKVCPFLAIPSMRRLPTKDIKLEVSGQMIPRNPGVIGLWTVREYKTWRPPNGGLLFDIGEPTHVEWYCQGRVATRAEVAESIRTGMPSLVEMAKQDKDPEGACIELERCLKDAVRYMPKD